MGRLGCHTTGGNLGRGSPCKTRSLNFSLLLDITPSSPSSLITVHVLEKKEFLIAFRQILPKILPAAYIFSNTIMINLKYFTGNKSLSKKQCPAELSPRIIPLNIYGKPWGWGRIPANSQKFSNFPTRKILLNKFTSSTVKSVIPSPSNSNFHLITPYKLYS